MKICFQTKTWGEGTGWFAQELASALAENGADVIYVAPKAVPAERDPKHPRVTRYVSRRELGNGPLLPRVLSSLARVRDGIFGCLSARLQTNTYLFSIPDPMPFFLPLQAMLRLLGARVYLIVHDATPHAWAGRARPPFWGRLALILSYRLSSHLIATTRDCRDEMIYRYNLSPARISVLPHGLFALGAPRDLPGNGNLLVFGSLRRNKQVLESIRAVQACRAQGLKVTLTIAGAPDRADPSYWADCQAEIARAPDGIACDIGFVPDDALEDLIAQSDAVLLPYRGFSSASGVAILMALSQRPLIASATGGIRDLFDTGMTGIALSADAGAEDIAAAISQFCAKPPAIWQQEAQKARAILLKALSWHEIAKGYLAVINQRGAVPGT
ncbi:glycosyltransferase involved in cell wall biosynthesis [Rhizomicrobium palustre]|uniref:Glycosyltransferase involved in cell wall biosynthesis n=1 Tax=Rhizomicrobium palustre TaxID=189966 RepID=A0A846MYN8_9PROT|nr:glycosyltransferase family 4 protein [Rhizomicrobium palustre]NIK88359.1 glycosyltransferase involved in cell wall biosynthesis [Rhizomicrobium palustre]